jgi:hypothetical protein
MKISLMYSSIISFKRQSKTFRLYTYHQKKMGNCRTQKFVFVCFLICLIWVFLKRLELSAIVTEMINQNSLIRLT